MNIHKTDLSDTVAKIALAGRLDVLGVDAVETKFTAMAAPSGKNVIVDMSEVGFVASLGLRMFVSVGRSVVGKGRRMVLFACQPDVAGVFEMAALDTLFTLAPDEAAALAALG